MKDRSSKRSLTEKSNVIVSRRKILYLVVSIALGAVLVWLYDHFSQDKSSEHPRQEVKSAAPFTAAEQDPFLIPEVTPARFRNTAKTVGYVGSRECLECHRDQHKSYLMTTHSRSLAEVDVSREPPSAEYHHELSGRHYRIYREGETLRLREFLQDSNGQEVVLGDHAARYALGSGNYARMYLIKEDDFLVEAPVTWYPRLKSWGMSAGYGKDPHQPGFNREIDANCLHCHSGRVETIDGAAQRLNIVEMAIGCERCHGPGALHLQERRAELPIRGGIDDSIVNLRHLSRERQEDVCSQCHLSGSAEVNVRGRSKVDFRPGLRMADFCISFRIDRPESAMTVSGQIEQMRLSRCYDQSKSMTCATCHNPHAVPAESEKVSYYRNKCLTCHKTESCGLPVKTRLEKEPQDNCIVCHMPRGPTDIPHFSFTHHRVGIHAPEATSKELTESDHLVQVVDVSHLPDLERLRLLGLANDIFAAKLVGGLNDETRDNPSYPALATVFQNRGRKILEEVRSQGLRDPEVETSFSCWNWRKNPSLCIDFATSALQSPQISPATRSIALYNLASSHFDQRRYAQALPYLDELVKLERREIPLMLLGICHQKKGNLPEAERFVKAAILAAPDRADLHSYLASIYQEMGHPTDAEWHLQRAKLLNLKVPQPE